jgi:hypothetical protein
MEVIEDVEISLSPGERPMFANVAASMAGGIPAV